MTAKKKSSRTGAWEVQYSDELSEGKDPVAVRSMMADRARMALRKAMGGEGTVKEVGLG